MNRRPTQALILAAIAVGCFAITLPGAGAAERPTAEEILVASRVNQVGQNARVQATLRHGRERTPFGISLEGGVIRYAFRDPEHELLLRLDETDSELSERKGGKETVVTAARFDERVRGTPVTYEDLALQFLYWPRPKIVGEERVKATGRNAWILELQAPRGKSAYGVVRLWVDKENGALMQIEGFDLNGKKVKRFLPISIQRLEGRWMLKEMRVEVVSPESGKVVDRAWMNLSSGE